VCGVCGTALVAAGDPAGHCQAAWHGNEHDHQSRRGWSAVPVGNSVAAVSVTQGWHNPHRSATANHCVVPLLQPRVRSDVAAAAACGVAAWA